MDAKRRIDATTLGAALAFIRKTKKEIISEFGNSKIFYGSCDTAAGTAAKVVSCEEFAAEDLENGVAIYVTFASTNTAADPTMNVSETGALPIKCIIRDTLSGLPEPGYLVGGQTYRFVYDGANWVTIFGGFVRVTDDDNGNVTIS